MSNLLERIAARNKAEKFHCEIIYPTVTNLFLDLLERYKRDEKLFLATGGFTKAMEKHVDAVLKPIWDQAPKNIRFWVSPEVFGAGTFRQTSLKFKGDYQRPSVREESVDYIPLHVPTLYLNTGDIERYKLITPPVYVELTEADIIASRETLATLAEKIKILEESAHRCKVTLSEVGEA